jgi:D-tyrosyl-tRNA(Tyr) deacylase
MKFVIQRAESAQVDIDSVTVGKIGRGFAVLIGICDADTEDTADKMISKMLRLRIFADADGKTNLDIASVNGGLLLVSQFTLYADCRKGNRPSFIRSGSPQHADELYEYIIQKCAAYIPDVQHGEFGADMKVSLVNDGPFTIVLDSEELGY